MRKLLIIVLMVGFMASCTKKNDKLSGFYLEVKKTIDVSVTEMYNYHGSKYINLFVRFNESYDDTLNKVRSNKLLIALNKDIQEFIKYRRSIDDLEAEMTDADEVNAWISKKFRDFKDAQFERLTKYETPENHLSESISSFKKKWDRDVDYLKNGDDLSLARLNLSKLKLDLLLMIMDAKEVYLTNWVVDRMSDLNSRIIIIDENKIEKNSTYKAKILFGLIDTVNVDEIVINDLRINDKLQNFKKAYKVNRIPEFEIDAKAAGKYNYKGYLKYKSAKELKYIPFEKSFVVE